MYDWRKALLTPDATFAEAIKVIDAGEIQAGIVVDSDGRLLGIVTDGDIRRAIVAGVTMDAPVGAVMTASPITAAAGTERQRMFDVLRATRRKHLPVVDDAGRVVDLVMFGDMVEQAARENWVVLMAGGLGARLQPLTRDTPKPLLPVGRKPLLETIVENFVAQGFRRIYLSVNYKADMIIDHFGDGRKWGIDIRYLRESEPLGTAGPLGILEETPTAPLIVMNGDLLTKLDFATLLDFHREHGAAATMCVREYDFQVPYGVVETDGAEIRSITEKPVHRFFINAGIYVLDPAMVAKVERGRRIDMTELFDRAMADGGKANVFPIREYWLDIGHEHDFRRANAEYEETFGK